MVPSRTGAALLLVALTTCFFARSFQVSGSRIKIDCHPIDGSSKEKCEALGCLWEPVNRKSSGKEGPLFYGQPLPMTDAPEKARVDEPWCYFPDDYLGYAAVQEKTSQDLGNRLNLKRTRPSVFGGQDIAELLVEVNEYDEGDIYRVKISDAKVRRHEPELPVMATLRKTSTATRTGGSKLSGKLERDAGGTAVRLTVKRNTDGTVLFSTDLSKLIFSQQFLQLNSPLASPFLFGLGEHYDTFTKWVPPGAPYRVFSFYNFDSLPLPGGRQSYGSFPFYLALDSHNASRAHGVYLRNSNAMDVILQSDQSVTFRPIGGILDFFILAGPTSMEVTQQFQRLVGLPEMPPRWALGFQLCRYNYKSLERTRFIWQRTRASGIPFEVQWNDIDYMDRHNDFTFDPKAYAGLPEFVDELHDLGMHYMLLFDPGLSQEDNYYPYKLGQQLQAFVRNATNQTLVGRVWNDSGRTVFPDFSLDISVAYWTELFVKFQGLIKYDGAWLDMNDISSFVRGSLDGCPSDSTLERPPYLPGGQPLQEHSLCLSARHRAGVEYDVHNLYSQYETLVTRKALNEARPNRRSLIISRSTSPGQGHYGGHWSGDLRSNWDYLKWSIPSLLEHSIYGFSLIGSDICGFTGNTTVQLCARWSTLGAFYTFSRNHNDDTSIDQDPVALGQQVVEANRNALTKRYSLLPYLYTLMHRAHRYGEPVARSLALEFHPNDLEALKVEYQFLWGPAIMLSPVVDQDTYQKSTYLPRGRWYEFNLLTIVAETNATAQEAGEPHKFAVPKVINSEGGHERGWHTSNEVALEDMPIFYRGGHVVPVYASVKQTIGDTVAYQPIGLEVALCPRNGARGQLYLDDGETLNEDAYNLIDFHVNNGRLKIVSVVHQYTNETQFGLVKVFGILDKKITHVQLLDGAGGSQRKSLDFQQEDHMLVFNLNKTPVTQHGPLIVEWS